MLFMRDICDEIHVYGIADSSHCDLVRNGKIKDMKYHYYGNGGEFECELMGYLNKATSGVTHRFTKEKIFYEKMILEWGSLYFHAPNWF